MRLSPTPVARPLRSQALPAIINVACHSQASTHLSAFEAFRASPCSPSWDAVPNHLWI